MEQSNLISARNRMEYPAFFTSNDLTFTGSTYTPTPAQLLLSSSELLQPSTAVQSTNTNSIFKSTVFDTSEHSTTD
ncbi:hypothetical protein WUBG_10741, partial [Wuchereria bancrofti]